jgi:hypothetical protein
VTAALRVPYADGSGYLNLDRTVNYANQIFSHQDDEGVQRHYDVTKLWRIARANPADYPVQELPLDAELADYLVRARSVERDHLDRITLVRLEEPGMVLLFDDTTTLILDGSHRFVKRQRLGLTTMRFVAFSEVEALPAKLVIPDAVGRQLLGLP